MAAPTVTVRSHHEYVDFMAFVLSLVRCMGVLSRKHGFLKELDDRMGMCWSSSINGRIPTEDQRKALRLDEVSVRDLQPRVQGALKDLHARLQWLDEYRFRIPFPDGSVAEECPNDKCRARSMPGAQFCRRCGAGLSATGAGQTGGWAVPSRYVHPREAMDQINHAMDDIKCLLRLDEEDELFKRMFEQMMVMAKWTRTSMCPTAEERNSITLGEITERELESHLDDALVKVVHYLHAFNNLYVNYPRNPAW